MRDQGTERGIVNVPLLMYRYLRTAFGRSLSRFRDEDGTNYLGGEYTSYRRGGAREKWEKDQQEGKKTSDVSAYTRAEDLVIAARARQIASP